jgi:hypothetical protein
MSGVGDVDRAVGAELHRALDLGAQRPQPLEDHVERFARDPEGEVDMRTPASSREPDLRRPQAEPRRIADQVPVASLSTLAVEGLLEPEDLAIEVARPIEVGDLQHELGDAADWRRIGHARELIRIGHTAG